jgi:hypothetical protein
MNLLTLQWFFLTHAENTVKSESMITASMKNVMCSVILAAVHLATLAYKYPAFAERIPRECLAQLPREVCILVKDHAISY